MVYKNIQMQTAHSFTQFGFFPYRIEQEISKGQNPTIIVSVYDKGNKKKKTVVTMKVMRNTMIVNMS